MTVGCAFTGNLLRLEPGKDVSGRTLEEVAPQSALSDDLREVNERILVELVVEAAAIRAVRDLRPHHRAPSVGTAVALVPRRDQDRARHSMERQRTAQPFERMPSRRVLGEVVNAKTGCASPHAKINERLQTDAGLDVLVAVAAFERERHRVENDQPNIAEALHRLNQLRHIGGWIEQPFPTARAHLADEMHERGLAASR